MECGAAETAAMFIGALVAALGAQIAARRLKMIATVFVTIAILPLVPGVGLYRAMSALATGDMMAGASIARPYHGADFDDRAGHRPGHGAGGCGPGRETLKMRRA